TRELTGRWRRPAAHRALGQNHDGLVCAYRPHTTPALLRAKARRPEGRLIRQLVLGPSEAVADLVPHRLAHLLGQLPIVAPDVLVVAPVEDGASGKAVLAPGC